MGANASTAGATTSSSAASATSPVAPGGSGKLIVRPGRWAPPVSSARPVPGYAGYWCVDTNSTLRVVPEDVLGAVAVVHVPVDDQHPLAAAPASAAAATATLLNRQNPWPRRGHRVVTGRSHDHEPGVGITVAQHLDRTKSAARGARRSGERPGRDDGVGIEHPAPTACEFVERVDVPARRARG